MEDFGINEMLEMQKTLQEKYKDKIQIYLGVEEDMIHPANRKDYDYIIGSSHYIIKDDVYYSVDGSPSCLQECLALFDGDPIAYAHAYYAPFCQYIKDRKPDIIGHFDLLTKFDELNNGMFLEDEEYKRVAAQYLRSAMESDCIFEINTGAISRGWRTTPYPSIPQLRHLAAHRVPVLINTDAHSAMGLDCYTQEALSLALALGVNLVQPEDVLACFR